jgi:hypothetical protein
MSGIKSGDIVNWRTTNWRGNPCSRRAEVYFAPQGETVMLYIYGLKKLKRVPLSAVRLCRAERKQANNLVREPARPTRAAFASSEWVSARNISGPSAYRSELSHRMRL